MLALELESEVLLLRAEPSIALPSRAGWGTEGAAAAGLCSKASMIHSGIEGRGRRMPSTSTCHSAKLPVPGVAAEAAASLL